MFPALFICHGAPSLAIEENEYTRYLQELGKQLGKPQAIVVFTAHWESDVLSITYTDDTYETIYDFGGFDDKLYSIKYPAKGSTAIASILEERFAKHEIPTKRDEKRGLDHGTWVVLRHLYPTADIPVIQISVDPYLPAKEQYRIGQALQGIGQENILVVGSGGTVHNLRAIKWGATEPEQWAVEFDDWIIEKLEKKDLPALFAYEELAPHASLAVPRAEHFVPLFLVMGSSGSLQPKLLHRSYEYGTLSHICFSF